MKALIISLLLITSQMVYSQVDEDEIDLQTKMTKTDIKDRFFLSGITSFYIDFSTSPLTFNRVKVGAEPDPNDPSQTIDKYELIPYQTSFNSYLALGLEPRINLKEFTENAAIGISAPFTFGFGQTFASSENVEGTYGIGNFQLPVLAKIYLGSGSTYQSDQNLGISLGAGFEVNKLGLIAPGASESERQALKAWVMPTASLGVHFWRGTMPMEVNLKYGFGQVDSYRIDKFGQFLSEGTRTTRASSLKITFAYLFNY